MENAYGYDKIHNRRKNYFDTVVKRPVTVDNKICYSIKFHLQPYLKKFTTVCFLFNQSGNRKPWTEKFERAIQDNPLKH